MMRKALVYVHNVLAAYFYQQDGIYTVQYVEGYCGEPISLTCPVRQDPYTFEAFPAFFDGVLPEGPQLEALLRHAKLDADDYFSQLMHVGNDLVGAVTVKEGFPDA